MENPYCSCMLTSVRSCSCSGSSSASTRRIGSARPMRCGTKEMAQPYLVYRCAISLGGASLQGSTSRAANTDCARATRWPLLISPRWPESPRGVAGALGRRPAAQSALLRVQDPVAAHIAHLLLPSRELADGDQVRVGALWSERPSALSTAAVSSGLAPLSERARAARRPAMANPPCTIA